MNMNYISIYNVLLKLLSMKLYSNIEHASWNCTSSLLVWELIWNRMSVLWSQSQHLFACSLILSFFSTKYSARGYRAVWKSYHLITCGHPVAPENLLNSRLETWNSCGGTRTQRDHWVLDQGRTQQNLGGNWWEMPLHHLYAESQISQLLSTLFCQFAMNKWHLSPAMWARDNHHMARTHYLVPACLGQAFSSRCTSLAKHL